jgi:hypothetical protein
VAGGGSSADGGGAGSSAVGSSSCAGGGGDGSSTVGGGSAAVGVGSSVDGGGVEGSAAVGDDAGASVVVGVGASLVPDEDGEGVEDAGCDVGAPSEAEEGAPLRVGASELLLPPGGPVDRLSAISMDLLDGQGIAELASAIPSRKLRRMVFSPSVPSSASTRSSTCSITPPATRPTAFSGLEVGLSESGASHESSETATPALAPCAPAG